MSERLEQGKCCICGSTIGSMGYGHDPAPVKNKGRCCDVCNDTKVIPQRLADFMEDKSQKEVKLS